MGYIYKITNDINKKIYIGKTINTIKLRWQQHLSNINRYKTHLYLAMKKYGYNHFNIEVIEEVSNNLLNEREKYWIKYYDSYYNGYNSTLGGDGYISTDEDNIITLWNNGNSILDIKKKLNTSHYAITKTLNLNNIPNLERIRRAHKKEGKQIVALDKNTLKPLYLYTSLSEAARCLNLKSCSRFNKILGDYTKTSKGFCWDLASNFSKNEISNLKINYKT